MTEQKKFERNGVTYISAPELRKESCAGCAAIEFDMDDCGGFPPSADDGEDRGCSGRIWIKREWIESPEQSE